MAAQVPPYRPSEPIQRLPIEAKPLRVGLFLLATLSAGAALFAEPRLAEAVRRGSLSEGWRFAPLGSFALFLGLYAVDRWFLVRRRSYPPGRAFFQVAFGVLFALLLLPSSFDEWLRPRAYAAATENSVGWLLAQPEAELRVIAVQALGFRGPSPGTLPLVLRAAEDRAEPVRSEALRVLSHWSGQPEADREGLWRWAKERIEATGAQ